MDSFPERLLRNLRSHFKAGGKTDFIDSPWRKEALSRFSGCKAQFQSMPSTAALPASHFDTAEALFDEAYEAGIVDQETRMLHVDANNEKFRMKVGKQETFESNHLEQLRALAKQEPEFNITVTVTKAY